MKTKLFFLLLISLCVWPGGKVFAMEHTSKNGLFSMNIPEGWHWVDTPGEIIIAYPDGQTVAVDIQLVPSKNLSQTDIKKLIKEGNDNMIKNGIEAHHGVLIDNKDIKLGGVYATQLDFKTSPPNPVSVTYISCFNKGFAMTITYGTSDDNMHSLIDDVIATLKFR